MPLPLNGGFLQLVVFTYLPNTISRNITRLRYGGFLTINLYRHEADYFTLSLDSKIILLVTQIQEYFFN